MFFSHFKYVNKKMFFKDFLGDVDDWFADPFDTLVLDDFNDRDLDDDEDGIYI